MKIFPGGEDNYVVPDYAARTYEFQVQLPGDINCDQCIVQWSYVAGNSWGTDPDGTSCTGCGQQETFRNCADIKIQPKYIFFFFSCKTNKTISLFYIQL